MVIDNGNVRCVGEQIRVNREETPSLGVLAAVFPHHEGLGTGLDPAWEDSLRQVNVSSGTDVSMSMNRWLGNSMKPCPRGRRIFAIYL
jgi:hypothetical protein